MAQSFARRLVALGASFMLALALPGLALATVSGGCTAEGHSSGGSSVDITTETVWHLNSGEIAGGSGSAPVPMQSATVGAYALGLRVPIRDGQGNGATSGSIDGVDLRMFATLGKIFVVAGSATGEGGSCDGQILVVLDDVDALFTLLGGGGLAVAIVAVVLLLLLSRSGGCVPKVLGALFGLLGGAGLGLSLEQFQFTSPTTYTGLAIAIVGGLAGFILAGRFAKAPTPPGPTVRPTPAPAAPPPPPPPPPVTPTPPADSSASAAGSTAGETQGFIDGVVAPAAAQPDPPSLPFGSAAVPTEDQKFIEGVFPSDAPAQPPAQPPAGPANDGESHPADDYGPENRPVGGGGPM